MTWECIPNFWCDIWKLSKGCHGGVAWRNTYWQGWGRSEWSHRCIPWNEKSEVGGLLKLWDPVSDGSYLEMYSVTHGKPVQLRQDRRNMIEARLLGHNACKGILNIWNLFLVQNGFVFINIYLTYISYNIKFQRQFVIVSRIPNVWTKSRTWA